jgi:hypothetical protein
VAAGAASVSKELLEPLRRQRRVARRILNVAMPEVRLDRTRVVSVVGLDAQIGRGGCPLDSCGRRRACNLFKHGIRRPRQGILEQVVKSGKIPVLDVGTAKLIRDGRINVIRGIAAISEDGVIFEGGEQHRLDAIIFATGYRPGYQNFLRLDEPTASSPGNGPAIHFVGFKNPVTGLLWEISKEAQSVANDIAYRLANRHDFRDELVSGTRPGGQSLGAK